MNCNGTCHGSVTASTKGVKVDCSAWRAWRGHAPQTAQRFVSAPMYSKITGSPFLKMSGIDRF